MDFIDLQMELGGFHVDMVGASVNALVDLWNEEITQAIGAVAPRCPLLMSDRPSSTLVY